MAARPRRRRSATRWPGRRSCSTARRANRRRCRRPAAAPMTARPAVTSASTATITDAKACASGATGPVRGVDLVGRSCEPGQHDLADRRSVLVAVRGEHLGVERGRAGLEEHPAGIGQLGECGRQLDLDDLRPGVVELREDVLEMPPQLRLRPIERGAHDAQPAGRDRQDISALPGQHALQLRHIGHGPGDRPGMVEPVGQRHHAVEWHGAVGPLEPDDPAVGGGAQDRADGLGADRGRDHPGGDRGRRSRRRPARRVSERPGIARGRRVAIGELGRVGLAEDDGARVAQPGDKGRIAGRERVGEGRRTGRGGHARDVDEVLDPDRHAVERPERPPATDVRVATGRLVQGRRRIQVRPGLDRGLERLDPFEARLGERDRGPLAELDPPRGLEHARVGRRGHHRPPVRPSGPPRGRVRRPARAAWPSSPSARSG